MTPTPLTFHILGPLAVTRGSTAVHMGGLMPRLLLATLLLHPNRIVYTDTLIDTLWPDHVPASALTNLRTYVLRLRSRLDTRDTPTRLTTQKHGYQLTVHPRELDLLRFRHLAATARRLHDNGDDTTALEHITTADGLWRGELLEDLPHSPAWPPLAQQLAAERTALTELATAILLRTGRHAAAIPRLRGLTATDPLHEGWWHDLILALHGDGQTAQALRAYAQARRILIDELGIEPGPRLRAALDTVLGRDDTDRICQLPIDTRDFTGRTEQLAELTAALTDPHPGIIAINGAPGTGKTALAVHTAYATTGAFPDGQLYIELNGTGPEPADPATAINDTLHTLGVPTADIPETLPAKTALYRSHLAKRRMLVILDDAAHPDQAAPLLPGAGHSAAVITSRTRMTGLPGAHHLNLPPLPPREAAALFTRLTKTTHPDHDTHAILNACGHLPLAITIAAAKLAHHPEWPPHYLAARLSEERRRLDHLTQGDLDARTTITVSYRQLPPPAAAAFRRLALLGPANLPAWTATALADPDPDHSHDVIETLIDNNLITLVGADPIGQPRIRLHDLLRCFALERLEHEPPAHLTAALQRLLDTWLALAARAADKMPVPFFGITPRRPPPRTPIPFITDHATSDPLTWFDTERHNLLAAVELAAGNGFDAHAWHLAAVLAPYYDLRARYDDWLTTHTTALQAATRTRDPHARALLTRNLGQLRLYQDRYQDAADAFTSAHAAFTALRDTTGAAVTLSGLGAVHRITGHHGQALAAQRRALTLFHTTANHSGEALVRLAIGRIHMARHRWTRAHHWLTTSLELAERCGDRHRQAQALHQLGILHSARDDDPGAGALLDEALAILEALGDRHCAAYVRQSIGELHLRHGDQATGRALLADSLQVQRRLGDRSAAEQIAVLLGRPARPDGRA